MASIQQREKNGKKSYTVKIRLKGHKSVFATFERKTDARKWATQTESAIREGRYFKQSEAQKHTLAELADRYIRDVLPHKPKIDKEYRRSLNWWKSEIGHLRLVDVTPARITECRDKLATGITCRNTQRSPATTNRYLMSLSSAFTIAIKEWCWMENNPVSRVFKLKEPRGRVRFLSDDERERLLTACKKSVNKNLYLIAVLALSTGARRMELWALTWQDVDLQRGMITLKETKNNEIRSIPLKGHALDLIREHSRVRRLDTNLIFPSKKDSQVPHDFRASFEKALKAAGIEDFRWHDLRHTTASYLAMQGASLAEIAAVLGHKSLAMVGRYSHIGTQHSENIVEKMNEKIFG